MRFYNSGKYEHRYIDSTTHETKTELRDLNPKRYEKGTALITMPGLGYFGKPVPKGEWIVLAKPMSPHQDDKIMDDEDWVKIVKQATGGALLTEEEAQGLESKQIKVKGQEK